MVDLCLEVFVVLELGLELVLEGLHVVEEFLVAVLARFETGELDVDVLVVVCELLGEVLVAGLECLVVALEVEVIPLEGDEVVDVGARRVEDRGVTG